MYITLQIHAHTQQKNKSGVADAKIKGWTVLLNSKNSNSICLIIDETLKIN